MNADAGFRNAYWLADHYGWPISTVLEMSLDEFNGHIAFLNWRQGRKGNG